MVDYVSSMFDSIDSVDDFVQLDKDWRVCKRCQIGARRQGRVVIGGSFNEKGEYTHNLNVRVLAIGQYPASKEASHGHPFVGPEGMRTRDFVNWYENGRYKGIHPDDIYWTNILGCSIGDNQHISQQDVGKCKPRLHSLIRIIKPRLIVTLGLFASRQVLMTPLTLRELRNVMHWYDDIPVISTIHPARLGRLLRDKAQKEDIANMILQIKADMAFVHETYRKIVDGQPIH